MTTASVGGGGAGGEALCSSPMLMVVVCEGVCAAFWEEGDARTRVHWSVCTPVVGGGGSLQLFFSPYTQLNGEDAPLKASDKSQGTFGLVGRR